MKAVLVRVGIDQTYGRWNGPVDTDSRQFVYVPIHVHTHVNCCEAHWEWKMPFRFERAPIFVSNSGKTDFPLLRQMLEQANRPTRMSKFASKFRGRTSDVPPHIAHEIITQYDRLVDSAAPEDFANSYEQAMEVSPPNVDRDRKRTYHRLLRQARSRPVQLSRCKKTGCTSSKSDRPCPQVSPVHGRKHHCPGQR
jgi:hypothetical protein